jgi:hypothetical protein
MIFPENFDRLHRGEEFIRARSKEAIQASETLLHHFNMVADSMNLIDHFARSYRLSVVPVPRNALKQVTQ